MSEELTGSTVRLAQLAEPVVDAVRRWCSESTRTRADARRRRLAVLLADRPGVDFMIGLVDRVVRPTDRRVAARALEALSRQVPRSFPWPLRLVIRLAGGFAPVVPTFLVPLVRLTVRKATGDPVLDAGSSRLGTRIKALSRDGVRLDVCLLGGAAPDDSAADRHLATARRLRARGDIEQLSISVVSVAGPFSMWAFEETVERISERLIPLYRDAVTDARATTIMLEVTRFRDLDLTIAVFTRVLETPEFALLDAGISLPAQLPDAFGALQELTAWARTRRANGGAPIRIRITGTGIDAAMESIDAESHTWPLAPFGTDRETDLNYVRMLDWVLRPERADAVRVHAAARDPFGVAFAIELAKERGVEASVDVELPDGTSGSQAQAILDDVGRVVLRASVVRPDEPGAAVTGLIRHLEQEARLERISSAVSARVPLADGIERQAAWFRAVLEEFDDAGRLLPSSRRRQDRSAPLDLPPLPEHGVFRNAPDTDPAIAANRSWARGILRRVRGSVLGESLLETTVLADEADLTSMIAGSREAGAEWGRRRATTRAQVLHAAGDALESARADLVEVIASEIGSTLVEGDLEVSGAVDSARYYADQAQVLEDLEHADVVSPDLIVVTSDRNSPAGSIAGGVFAALASGAAVIVVPAPHGARTAAVLVEALWNGGVPRAVLSLADVTDAGIRRALVTHPAVDRVILAGERRTAALFRSWRSDLPLLASTGGKNAIVVMPSADPDAAIADIVESAFGRAGQSPSTASLVILVGSIGRSRRFRRRLVEAVTAVRVGMPDDPATRLGPLVEQAQGTDLLALTQLGSHERWLLRPEKDRSKASAGRLWSAGIRDRVSPGSPFHLTANPVPVLGVMYADTLEEALTLQNAPSAVSTAGIHSLEPDELAEWVERVDAGSLFVNRAVAGPVAGRRPAGTGKRTTVGPAGSSGGRNLLFAISEVEPLFDAPAGTVALTGVSDGVRRLIEASQPSMTFLEFDRVRTAVVSDQREWTRHFGVAEDVATSNVERNLVRYRPAHVAIRVAEGATHAQFVRVLAAATRARAVVEITSASPLPTGMTRLLASATSPVRVTRAQVESDADFLERLRTSDPRPERIRLVGGAVSGLAHALARGIDGDLDVALYAAPVTTEGRIELLPFLREQTITITAHRFGRRDRYSAFRLPEELPEEPVEELPEEPAEESPVQE